MPNFEERCRIQENEIGVLRERVATLEAAQGIGVDVPIQFCLTVKETTILGILMKRDIATKPGICSAMYSLINTGEKDIDPKIIDVFVCKMRKKLKPYGIDIGTKWGQGYYLGKKDKAIVLAVLAEERNFHE